MKLPLSWLKDYVDIDCSVEELERKLFSCGFEVEEKIFVGKNIDKIVTCKILSIDQHPNADKLSVTKVDAGKYGELQIITSAKNIKVGDVVPVAVDGATLNNGERIFNGELRGLPSFGMFCSGEELGINDNFYKGASINGILILEKDFPLGEEVKNLLGIEDVVFDINVTANRPDCQSILGLAREVAVVLDKPLKMPDFSFVADENVSTKNTVKVENNAFDLCQRYKACLVKDVVIEESPAWIKKRLFSMGLNSINNIVDITNFVLLEIGQPMHAFDLADLKGNAINVRRASEGEKIITLDESEFSLNGNHLVICDSEKPVALAGIMGGLNSEIKSTTRDVVFESAKFSRDNVRKTSKALGQRSDSSSRFEKGVDYLSVDLGLKRALNLINTLKCGKIAIDQYDLIDKEPKLKVINTKISKINGVLGIEISPSYIKEILEKLEFGVKLNGDDVEITVPLFREDVEDYPDIAEEIIREYGYDHIKSTLLATSAITNGGKNTQQRKIDDIKSIMTSFGFNEIITYSFVNEKDYETFGIDKNLPEHKFVKLLNPLSEDTAIMRTTLIPSIIKTVAFNLNRKNNEGRIFELAKVYNPTDENYEQLPNETQKLSFAVFGAEEDFYSLKGVVEGLINNFANGAKVNYVRSKLGYLHPTRGADLYLDGELVGNFGQINPEVLERIGIDKPVYACELNYDLLSKHFNDKIVFKTISKYPTIERDLAVTVDESVSWADIENVVIDNAGEFLSKIKLFDIYRGDQVEKGKKSVAFNMLFVSIERTLGVEEIDEVVKNILTALKEKVGAELR